MGTRLTQVLNEKKESFRIFDKTLELESYCDVTDPSTLNSLPHADAVINLAAEHRDDVTPRSLYEDVNVRGARYVCDYCRLRKVNKIIFTSSVAIYGFAPEGTDESGAFNPFNEYGKTKLEAERIYRAWQAEQPERRSLVIVRPTVIFGEQNRGNVYNLLRQIATGRFVMFGNGNNKKSMAYVQNVAEFLAFSVGLGAGEHIYNYVDTPDMDMNTLVSRCRSILFGKNNVGIRLPGWVGAAVGRGFDILAMMSGRPLAISSIRVKKFMGTTAFGSSVSATGFKPPYSLEDALERTLRHEFLDGHKSGRIFYSE